MSNTSYDIAIIGGGFYGCVLALFLRQYTKRIVVLEKGDDLLTRASYVNQARVHNGYHYPRSMITALRSRINFPRFIRDYQKAIEKDFTKVYAVARQQSKVNAKQFERFCKTIGAKAQIAPKPIRALFNNRTIEEAFIVQEYAFNAATLRSILKSQLKAAGIEVRYNTEVKQVTRGPRGILLETDVAQLEATKVYNCSYSQINVLLEESGLPILPLKHELTEMALIRLPEELQHISVTVMDGPFFSIMPFPDRGCSTLSHVRYTPHGSWTDGSDQPLQNPHKILNDERKQSHFPQMVNDAMRFIPILEEAVYQDSLFEVKTVLVHNEADDGRPILFRSNYGMEGLSVVMGGKIDNIYDIIAVMKEVKAGIQK